MEVNVAIIVSCMPALAHLLKLHVGDLKAFRSLRSKLLGSYRSDNSGPSNKESRELMPTIGSTPVPRRRNYYSLMDGTLLESQISATEHTGLPESGIVRSVMISQNRGQESGETLVSKA